MIKGQPLSPVIEYRTFRQKHDKLTMFTIVVRTAEEQASQSTLFVVGLKYLHATDLYRQLNKNSTQLQNTLPLICMSLNTNSIYCVMLRSSKNADQRKQWWYRVAGYSAVAPKILYWTYFNKSTGENEDEILPTHTRPGWPAVALALLRDFPTQTRRKRCGPVVPECTAV